MKKATIFNRIISHETTSVEIISVLGRELYIYNGIYWTDVLNKFGFSYTPEAFCQYIADYEAWVEHNGTYRYKSKLVDCDDEIPEWSNLFILQWSNGTLEYDHRR